MRSNHARSGAAIRAVSGTAMGLPVTGCSTHTDVDAVDLAQQFAADDCLGSAAGDDTAAGHERDAVGERGRERHVVHDGERREVLLAAELRDQEKRFDLVLEIEMRRRLVEQHAGRAPARARGR